MSRRLCLALDLADDGELIAEYEKLHQPGSVWPDVLAHIRASGMENMQIWRTGDRMVMVADLAPDYPRPTAASLDEAAARWEALMWRFQKPLPGGGDGEKWRPMHCIFDLGAHNGGAA